MHILTRFLLVPALILAGMTAVRAQEIPADKEIVTGKLDNGMTYYIRHNANPKGCADFYIAHNVGALQEEDNQNGLAHFLEHMAFNGTRHYPEKKLLEFLSTEGVRFGYNVNAYTSRYETVYNLSDIPLVRESFVDSCLLILHDWSCDISCEPQALDDERGVISEEWRRSDDQRSRMARSQNNLIYRGAKHTQRSVLGTLEIINGFKRQEILDFYDKWYRPDLQAIIAVGDFDASDMEARIRRIFSDIPAAKNPAAKETYEIPAIDEPVFEHIIDPDIKFQALKVVHRLPYPKAGHRADEAFWQQHYTKQIISQIVSHRMQKAAKRSGSPVSSAVLVTNSVVADFYTSMFTLSAKTDKVLEETLRFYEREIKRILDHGFTEDEFEAARFQVAKRNRLDTEVYDSDITNEMIVNICKEHYLRSRALAWPADIHQAQVKAVNSITFDDALACLPKMFRDSEKIYSYNIGTSRKDKIPSVEVMKGIIAEVQTETLQPEFITYPKVDLELDAPEGSVVKTGKIKGLEGELWTLSNGAKVYWLPCDEVKSNVHLVMNVRFDTGYRTWAQDKIAQSKVAAAYVLRNHGFASYSAEQISSNPKCGGIRTSVEFAKEYAGISINTDSDDVEVGFKMLQNYLERPYFDTEKILDKFKKDNLRNLGREESSTTLFSREQVALKYGNHPWSVHVDSAAVEGLDMDFIKELYDRNFGDPKKMTVFICSDLDRNLVMDLVQKHVASYEGAGNVYAASKDRPYLPSYRNEVVLDRNYPIQSAPKADVEYDFLATVKEGVQTSVSYDILNYIMSQRYVSRIREERGGTYHVRFASETYGHKGLRHSFVPFQTRPEMVDILLSDTQELMDEICENGPKEEELENAVKYLIKAAGEKKQKHANSLARKMVERENMILYGEPFGYDYEKAIRAITVKDIRNLARKINNGDRFISIYREQ